MPMSYSDCVPPFYAVKSSPRAWHLWPRDCLKQIAAIGNPSRALPSQRATPSTLDARRLLLTSGVVAAERTRDPLPKPVSQALRVKSVAAIGRARSLRDGPVSIEILKADGAGSRVAARPIAEERGAEAQLRQCVYSIRGCCSGAATLKMLTREQHYPVVIINWVHYLGPPGPSTS